MLFTVLNQIEQTHQSIRFPDIYQSLIIRRILQLLPRSVEDDAYSWLLQRLQLL